MAGRRTNRPLSGVLSDFSFARTSFSQSIREGHEHLLNNEGHEDVELQRRISNIESNEDHPRLHLERLFGTSDVSTDTIARTPVSFENDIPQTNYHKEKKVNVVEHSNYGEPQQAVPGTPPSVVKMWNPLWLRKAVLLGFVILFALMLVALGLLYQFATMNGGLSTQISRNHYSWTYGPTALLILIISLWRQVDYWCRALVPWQEMRGGPAAAERSLLLDYISPTPVAIVWAALENRHWLVITSTGGLFLLKLIAVFSTALLTLQPTSMTKSGFPLTTPTILDSKNFNTSNDLSPNFNGLPVLTYYGLLDKGLPYPNGTLDDKAYEPVEPAIPPPKNASITANTFAFFPELECEIALLNSTLQPHNSTTLSDKQSDLSVTIATPDCTLTERAWTNVLCDPHWEDCPKRNVLSLWGQTGNEIVGEECKSIGPNDTRLVFIIADMRYEQSGLPSKDGEAKTWSTSISKMTGVLCHPKYSIRNATITIDSRLRGNNDATNVTTPPGPGFQLPGFSNLNLTNIMSSSRQFTQTIRRARV